MINCKKVNILLIQFLIKYYTYTLNTKYILKLKTKLFPLKFKTIKMLLRKILKLKNKLIFKIIIILNNKKYTCKLV